MTSKPLNLLLINQYFPPDTSATAKVADRLARFLAQKHRVTVLAGRPSYAPTELHPYYLRRTEAITPNLSVIRVGSSGYHRGRMRQRVWNYLSFMALALPQALTVQADVIVAMTDPPLAGLLGAAVARLRQKPFVYYLQDLHPDMALVSGMVQPSGWVNGWERLHRWTLQQATRIIVLGEDMKSLVAAKGIDPDRVEVVRTGADLPAELPPPDNPVSREIRGNFNFVMIHAGNLGFYGAWETLIAAVKLLDDPAIGLIFIGDGAAKTRLEALAGHNPRIRFLPFRPAADIPYVLAAADIHIVTIRQGAEGVIVPSKLYPILAAGKPVLAVAPAASDAARLITRHHCGLAVSPTDPAALAVAITQLACNRAQLLEMGRNARLTAQTYNQAGQFVRLQSIIEQAANKM